jgi:hypothetical protein
MGRQAIRDANRPLGGRRTKTVLGKPAVASVMCLPLFRSISQALFQIAGDPGSKQTRPARLHPDRPSCLSGWRRPRGGFGLLGRELSGRNRSSGRQRHNRCSLRNRSSTRSRSYRRSRSDGSRRGTSRTGRGGGRSRSPTHSRTTRPHIRKTVQQPHIHKKERQRNRSSLRRHIRSRSRRDDGSGDGGHNRNRRRNHSSIRNRSSGQPHSRS